MFDLKLIRKNPAAFDQALGKRGHEPIAHKILEIDERKRRIQTDTQDVQFRRNDASKRIGDLKRDGLDTTSLMTEVSALKDRLHALEEKERLLIEELNHVLSTLPNIPLEEIPVGKDEHDNVLVRTVGQKPTFTFAPKDHVELGEKRGAIDFTLGAKLSGARFVVLRNKIARLERALANFMLDHNTIEFGYEEINPPLLVKSQTAYGTGNLPKFKDDLFQTTNGYWLIPTAEMSLTNLVADDILDEMDLPKRFTAMTPCFRSEAGSAGRDTRGMIRQHQFSKVELVSITTPQQAMDEHERMLSCAESLLQKLGLHYRVMLLCTGDMSPASQKTYDIEVWIPSQNTFREISSCSMCGDYQARRMNARYRAFESKGTEFVYTLNGSGLPLGRTLVAILENYQNEDGSIRVPDVLQPYINGEERINV